MDDVQRDFMKLVQRSEKNANKDGWIPVSDMLWPTVQKHAEPDLVELRADQHCRLTDEGRVMLKWL